MGRLLFVNLSTKEIWEREPGEEFYRRFLGGYGIGVKVIFDEQKPQVNPLGEESILGFTTGLFTGTGIPFSGRYIVVGKSPLTGTWGDANSGGFFGPELKRTGYDAIFFKGISKKPVYLWVYDRKIEIRDACHLWGKDTAETEDAIKQEMEDSKIAIASIGPAGEKLSLISGVMTDRGRAAARSGLGAVMGSKKLKAVVVKGSLKVPIANPEDLEKLKQKMLETFRAKAPSWMNSITRLLKPIIPSILRRETIMSATTTTTTWLIDMFRRYGTTGFAAISSESGDAPIKNWIGIGREDFPMSSKASKISDDELDKYKVKPYACAACPLGCGAIMQVNGEFKVNHGHRPEYETIAAFGMMNLVDNPEAIIKASDICNRYGLDTISAGTAISFAIECYENGLITKKDADGLELTWGNTKSMINLLEKIAKREGFGEILADGVKRASERIGKGSEEFAIHVGGQEVPMHDPRLTPSYATTYLTDPTPGRHTAGGAYSLEMGFGAVQAEKLGIPKLQKYDFQGKGKAHATLSNIAKITDCTGMCMFSTFIGLVPYVKLINAVTSWGYTMEELMLTGERIQTLRQVFNVREGITPSSFAVPKRVLGEPPLQKGPTAGKTIDVISMAKSYYKAMDWDYTTGKPSRERLEALALTDIARDFYGRERSSK